MKKTIAAAMSAAMVFCFATSAFAATSVTVNNNAFTYISGRTENVDITNLLTNVKTVAQKKETKATQTITIDSKNFNTNTMEFRLILSEPASEKTDESMSGVSAVDYFTIDAVKTAGGKVIYSEDSAVTGKTSKKILLGQINSKTTYTVELSANSAVDTSKLSVEPTDVIWELEYTDVKSNFTPTAAPSAAPTANAPAQPISTHAPTAAPSAAPTQAPTAAPQATASAAPGATVKPTDVPEKVISVLCTAKKPTDSAIKTVTPGSYRLVGNGYVMVSGSDGTVKMQANLDSTKDSKGNGVANKSSVITTLAEGDTLTIEGGSNTFIQFQSPNAATATATTTAKPKTAAAATIKPGATATPGPKKNPSTGDAAPIAGIAALAVCALGAAVYVVTTSRKKKQ
ncbi:MAG: hypothetical protein PUF72_02290 [Clostridiales bacterium]|nr:hypothetical protein [Clostridiales bacterium]